MQDGTKGQSSMSRYVFILAIQLPVRQKFTSLHRSGAANPIRCDHKNERCSVHVFLFA